MDEPTSADVAIAAVDALLRVVDQSAHDLHEFHDVVTRARRSALPTFPRATVLLTERIVDKLTTVESELEEVLLGLGISGRPAIDPVANNAVTPEDALRSGQDAIAKYADGLESTDEAVAALDAADRQLEELRQNQSTEAARPLTTNTRTIKDDGLSTK